MRLDEVQRRFDSGTDENNPGACEDIEEDSFPAIQDLVRDLPDSVDPEVQDTLEDGLARLRELTQEGCSDVEPTETETTEETTPPRPRPRPPRPRPPRPRPRPPRPRPPRQPTTPQDPGSGETAAPRCPRRAS